MRRLRLAAIAVLAGALLVAAISAAGRPPTRGAAPEAGPVPPAEQLPPLVAVGADPAAPRDRTREQAIAELATRLQGDPAARGRRGLAPGDVAAGVAAVKRTQRSICGTSRNGECLAATRSRAVREQWGPLRGRLTRRATATLLVDVGLAVGMTGTEVLNTVRTELDARLQRDVRAGRLRERTYERALACFDRLRGCDRLVASR